MRPSLLWHLGRLVSWPHWRSHALRTILTSLGVALGVATVVGIADVSRSVLGAFRSMVEAVAGEAELEISSPIGNVDQAVAESIATVPGVEATSGIIEQFLSIEGAEDQSVYLLGIDFLGSSLWRKQFPREAIEIDAELAFLNQLDSVAVPRDWMRGHDLALGDHLRVVTPNGSRELTIRGVITDAPAARLFGGALLLMDLPAAQALLDRAGQVDRIGVDVADGADIERVRASIHERLASQGAGVPSASLEVESPEARGDQAEKLLFSLRVTLAIMSAAAVIVGAFIVYHTIVISVQERRRHFALLNASGIGRRSIVALCIGEATLLAVPGVLAGIALGRALAHASLAVIGGTVSEIWTPLVIATPGKSDIGALAGVVVGLAVALGAAFVAIRSTMQAPTVETLRPGGLSSEDIGAVAVRIMGSVVLIASAWLICFVPEGAGFIAAVGGVISTHTLAYLGAAFAAAPLVWLLGVASAALAARGAPLPVLLAAQNLPRQPGRSGGTVATIIATMSLAVVVVTLVCSFEAGWVGWIEQHFGADLFVGRGSRVRLIASTPMGREIGLKLAALPGVESVEPFRSKRIAFNGSPIFLQGVSVDQRLRRGGLPMIEGTFAAAADGLRKGTEVLVSDNLAYRLGVHRGDVIRLPTRSGLREFEVAGTYVDYLGSLDLGAVMVADEQLQALWGDRYANMFRVWLKREADPSQTTRSIKAVLKAEGDSGNQTFFVMEAGEFLEGIRKAVQRFFAATWALQGVAVLVGVFGVINTQLASVLDRSSEIAVLRTIGLSRRDIVRSIVLECGALGALGGVLGVALGLVLGAQIVLVSLRLVTGWRMAFHVPWGQVALGVIAATFVSAVAGYVPARTAARLRISQRSMD